MASDDFVTELLTLCHNKNKSNDGLVKFMRFVEGLSYEEIDRVIRERITNSDGLRIINAVFQGLSQSSASQKKRLKLIELLLSEIFDQDIIPRDVSSMLTTMVFEVDKLSHTHLLRISDLCVEYIGKTEDAQKASCWQELLPKILSVIVSVNEFNHYGTDMSGEEYKQQVITTICQAKWNPRIVAPVAAMFVHIPLTKDQHGKIIAKLCHSVEELSPEELPPLVHQLLQLTKSQNALLVFFALKKYFNRHMYHLTESTSMLDSGDHEAQRIVDAPASPELFTDGNTVEATKREVEESEAMVLYHVEEVVKRSFCTTELIKAAKGCIPCAEIMVDPFFLSVLLIITSVQSYEVQVLDILKNMITRLVDEEEKRDQSDWLRKVLNTRCNVEIVIQKLIKSKACEHEAVLKGLLSLSMALLKSSSRTVARYGRIIATNLALKHNIITGGLLDTLVSHIIGSPEVIQYIECMDELCDAAPYLVNNYPQIINRLLEILPSLPEIAAAKVIYAMVSLIKTSSKMRDNLILILRKSLFIHNASTRTLAVSGFLQLLKRLKIKGMQTLSQNSFQAYTCPSVFTQTIMDLHSQSASSTVSSSYNEGLCLEIIQLLKRCFSLQAPIKIAFYSGLPKALTKNPELCVPVVEVFLLHLASYYESGDDKLPPLKFSQAVSIVKDEITLQEPIGHLIFVIYQIISTHSMTSFDDDVYNLNVSKLENIMNSLVARFIKLQPRHLDLDDDHDATTSEESIVEETVKQCMNVYHSLMVYNLSTWTDSTTLEDSKLVVSLYKSYANFETASKGFKSTKKPGSRGNKKTQEPNTTQAPSPTRKSHLHAEISLDLKSIDRLLTLVLGEPADWCSKEVAEELGKRAPLRRYCLSVCLQILNKEKSKLKVHRSKTTLEDIRSVGRLIFSRCIARFEEAMEFDEQSAILALDVFNEICSITFSTYKRQTREVLIHITEMDGSDLDDLFKSILQRYQSAFVYVLQTNDNNDDLNFKRSVVSILKGLQYLSLELPINGAYIHEAYSWLRDIAVTKSLPSPAYVKTLITLLFTLMTRCKSDSSLHDNIALQLCGLFGSINDDAVDEATVKLAVLTDSTKDIVYPILCTALNSRLDAVDWTVSRAKAELALISQPDATSTVSADRSSLLKRKEMELVTELSLIVSAARWLTSASIPLDCAEIACKLLHHIYTSLVGFTKYFMGRGGPVYQEVRFGKLVKSAASHLSSLVSQFLLYIESADIDTRVDVINKKLSVKVLRRAKKQIAYIPRLVTELENFTKCVTQLGIKYKDPSLDLNMKLTTVRDFRLNMKKIEEAMKRGREGEDEDVELGNVTVVLPTTSTQQSNQSPPKKRKRTNKKTKKSALKQRKTT